MQPGSQQPAPAGQSAPQPQPVAFGQQPANGPGQPAAPPQAEKKKTMAPGMANTSQNSLLISEIRDNMVIMNDGSMRTAVSCQSINYDLMSEGEREGVEYAYQNFLNSLYFAVQVLVRSQRVDLGPYLDRMQKLRRDQDNMLLGVLMDDYIDFVDSLAEETNIMEKSFFVIIPYFPAGDMNSAINSSKNFLANLFTPQTQQFIRINEQTYSKAKDELRNRSQTVVNGLMQMGVRATRLNTKQLGEMYYNAYNPDTAVRQPIGDFSKLAAPVITKGQGPAPQPNLERNA